MQSGHGMLPISGRASALNLYEGRAMKVWGGQGEPLKPTPQVLIPGRCGVCWLHPVRIHSQRRCKSAA